MMHLLGEYLLKIHELHTVDIRYLNSISSVGFYSCIATAFLVSSSVLLNCILDFSNKREQLLPTHLSIVDTHQCSHLTAWLSLHLCLCVNVSYRLAGAIFIVAYTCITFTLHCMRALKFFHISVFLLLTGSYFQMIWKFNEFESYISNVPRYLALRCHRLTYAMFLSHFLAFIVVIIWLLIECCCIAYLSVCVLFVADWLTSLNVILFMTDIYLIFFSYTLHLIEWTCIIIYDGVSVDNLHCNIPIREKFALHLHTITSCFKWIK